MRLDAQPAAQATGMSPAARACLKHIVLGACWAASLSAVAVADNFSMAPPSAGRPWRTYQRPPKQFQRPTSYVIQTFTEGGAQRMCASLSGNEQADGCERYGVVMIGNPCEYRGETFADLLCHEQAHANGWPANHPRD